MEVAPADLGGGWGEGVITSKLLVKREDTKIFK